MKRLNFEIKKRNIRFIAGAMGMLIALILVPFEIANAVPKADWISQEEREWLQSHPVIRYGHDSEFPPYEFYDPNTGQARGVNIEILESLEKELGIEIQILHHDKWIDTLNALEKREIDLIAATRTEKRMSYATFTQPYSKIPSAVIIQEENRDIESIDDLKGKSVSTVTGWSWNDILEEEHPEINIVPYDDVKSALYAVSFGDVDATIQDYGTATYHIPSYGITNLKMIHTYERFMELSFAVRKDYDIFADILEKFLQQNEKDIEKIILKWTKLEIDKGIDSKFVLRGFALILILGTIILSWNWVLRTQVNKKTKDLQRALDKSEKMKVSIEQINSELKDSITELSQARAQIMEQEKWAAIGSFVAGIAHDVNTPLGASITIHSHMEEILKASKEKYEEGTLKKTDLEELYDDLTESLELLDGHLVHSTKLIQNFKEVSIHQINETVETFNICTYLRQIALGMKYECKKKGAIIELNCPVEQIMLTSSPGLLAQIFTNLITNSLKHGFEDMDSGIIKIAIGHLDGQKGRSQEKMKTVEILYEDNGKGMDAQTLEMIFKPFFTTKKDRGGSGLGMHIVHTIVTQKLGGEITVRSRPQEGVKIQMSFPLNESEKDQVT